MWKNKLRLVGNCYNFLPHETLNKSGKNVIVFFVFISLCLRASEHSNFIALPTFVFSIAYYYDIYIYIYIYIIYIYIYIDRQTETPNEQCVLSPSGKKKNPVTCVLTVLTASQLIRTTSFLCPVPGSEEIVQMRMRGRPTIGITCPISVMKSRL